jgi:hypothetical protein
VQNYGLGLKMKKELNDGEKELLEFAYNPSEKDEDAFKTKTSRNNSTTEKSVNIENLLEKCKTFKLKDREF